MKKLNLIFLFSLFLIFINVNSHTIFPNPKSNQEKICNNRTNPSLEVCKSIEPADKQEACCFITYKDKETEEEFSRCGYLENTEYGIKVYKHIWAQYKQIKVLCESYYNGRFISISLLIIFLFI